MSERDAGSLGFAEPPVLEAIAARAEQDAAAAAARSGVAVRSVSDTAVHQKVAAVLQRIWQQADGPPLAAAMLRVLEYTGNYVAAAFDEDRIVGAAVGFRTDHGILHSHIAGVLPSHQGRSVGYALKLHQKAWALRRRICVVAWTFDPLIRRNAHFNLVKLGALVADFLPDFYGEMNDRINAGDHSDRLLVEWDLRRSGIVGSLTTTAGAVAVLRSDRGGRPELLRATGTERVLQIPADMESLRRTDPALSGRWRAAFREAIADAFADGHRIVGLDSRNCYVTRKEPA